MSILHRAPAMRRRSTSVQAINRRAARILTPAALGLATLLALAATKPAALWLLAWITSFGLVALAAYEAAHLIVGQLARRNTR